MRLISLNLWAGKMYQPLINFIKENSSDTNLFCLQEVFSTKSQQRQFPDYRANLLEEISKVLEDFNCFYAPIFEGLDIDTCPVNFDLKYGLAIFVKKTITVEGYESFFIYKDKVATSLKEDFSDIPINIQRLYFSNNGKRYSVYNFHGSSYPGSKLDTPQRLDQSSKVYKLLNDNPGGKILTGDFNLLPDTQSIKIFEKDMINLIKEYKIERTRSNLSPFYNTPDFQRFADYTFVSKDIKVQSFKVLEMEISDHLPMLLDFS